MLSIKIFEWHGVGQEAIAYANNEVGRNRQDISLPVQKSTKVHLYVNQRDDKSINLQNTSTFPLVNLNDIRLAVFIYFNIIKST